MSEERIAEEEQQLRAWPEQQRAKIVNRMKLLAALKTRLEKGEITADEYEAEFPALQRQARAGKL